MTKRETIEEYLQRGGTIIKLAPVLPKEEDSPKANPTVVTGSVMMTLAEGSLFYAESRAKKTSKKKKSSAINVDALPASLRKYLPKTGD